MSEQFKCPLCGQKCSENITDPKRTPEAYEAREAMRESHDALVEALARQVKNIERWMESGIPAGPEESKSIYDQMKAALLKAGVTP